MDQLSAIGRRLREVRQQMGLSQSEFALLVGSTRRLQSLYERGIRSPDTEYLVSMAVAELDLIYVLMGQHMDSLHFSGFDHRLSRREKIFLALYHAASDDERSVVEATARRMALAVGSAGAHAANDDFREQN